MKKITNPALAARVAAQIAGNTGVEVRCGNARAVPTKSERDAFRV